MARNEIRDVVWFSVALLTLPALMLALTLGS